jgi:hypothetical protein
VTFRLDIFDTDREHSDTDAQSRVGTFELERFAIRIHCDDETQLEIEGSESIPIIKGGQISSHQELTAKEVRPGRAGGASRLVGDHPVEKQLFSRRTTTMSEPLDFETGHDR